MKPWEQVTFTNQMAIGMFMHATYDEAERRWRQGYCSDRTWRWYLLFWTWCAGRYSDLNNAATKQDRFFRRRGGAALERRFARVLALRERKIQQLRS